MAAAPGLLIGVGGNPTLRYVLYGPGTWLWITFVTSRPCSRAPYTLVASICSGRWAASRFRMTRATFAKSSGYFASDCAIDAMISCSYGVRWLAWAAAVKFVVRAWSVKLVIIWPS